jgi:DnaK suppressor protein
LWTLSCNVALARKRLLAGAGEFQGVLERKEAELVRVLRTRDGIAIEKSADQMDEIQYASERDLAIRNVDRETTLLRQVKTALLPILDW